MKKTLAFIFLFFFHYSQTFAFTEPTYVPTKFMTFSSPHYEPQGFCDIGSIVTLDRSELMGSVVFLTDFLDGMCEVYIPNNERYYLLIEKELDCGSKKYIGHRNTIAGEYVIEIIDHRYRTCTDFVDSILIVTETDPEGMQSTLYHHMTFQ